MIGMIKEIIKNMSKIEVFIVAMITFVLILPFLEMIYANFINDIICDLEVKNVNVERGIIFLEYRNNDYILEYDVK